MTFPTPAERGWFHANYECVMPADPAEAAEYERDLGVELAAMARGYMYGPGFVATLPPEPRGHRCGCTSDDECPHECDCEAS